MHISDELAVRPVFEVFVYRGTEFLCNVILGQANMHMKYIRCGAAGHGHKKCRFLSGRAGHGYSAAPDHIDPRACFNKPLEHCPPGFLVHVASAGFRNVPKHQVNLVAVRRDILCNIGSMYPACQ